MSDDRVLLVAGDVVGAHAGEEIVRVVVLAHVIEAEPPIFALAQTPLGRAMGRRRLAARPLAGRALRAQPTVLVGLHPDAVEQGESYFMTDQYARAAKTPSSLDKLFVRFPRQIPH